MLNFSKKKKIKKNPDSSSVKYTKYKIYITEY